ncbi:hypothetical protein E5288_WYG004042 [Bos mutus]|uniref:Uncharacterized protein n=1 Tax=Bos mutus TaxID=72004 RepID=A0A6B0S2N0_9CETA|nr:hypothetical protein [Bos mutus]
MSESFPELPPTRQGKACDRGRSRAIEAPILKAESNQLWFTPLSKQAKTSTVPSRTVATELRTDPLEPLAESQLAQGPVFHAPATLVTAGNSAPAAGRQLLHNFFAYGRELASCWGNCAYICCFCAETQEDLGYFAFVRASLCFALTPYLILEKTGVSKKLLLTQDDLALWFTSVHLRLSVYMQAGLENLKMKKGLGLAVDGLPGQKQQTETSTM